MVSKRCRSSLKRRPSSKFVTQPSGFLVRNDAGVESHCAEQPCGQTIPDSDRPTSAQSRADLMEAELLSLPTAAGTFSGSDLSGEQYGGQELLSGLPNEITVDCILTRLSRKTLYHLSCLNHIWRDVFQTGILYNAQIRTGNTQTLIVVTNSSPKPDNIHFRAISLYDPAQDAWHLLPPVPGIEEGLPSGCQCVVFKGKLYVMGGFTRVSAKVWGDGIFMFDLGSYDGKWKQCGSMEFPREDFSCLVENDGIYLFGGLDLDGRMCRDASVYHPENACWTRLPDMLHNRAEQKVLAMNGDFWIYGGDFWCEGGGDDDGASVGCRSKSAQMEPWTEMYISSKMKWCEVKNFTLGRQKGPYVAVDGDLYHVNHDSVDIFNSSSKSWQRSQINIWRVLDKVEVRALWPTAASFVGGELFILLAVEDKNSYASGPFKVIPMKSVGFSGDCTSLEVGGSHARRLSGERRLVWQQIGCPFGFGLVGEANCSIQPIQLGSD